MADNTVPITAGSGTSIRTVTNAAVNSGAHQQVYTIAGADGQIAPTDPDGTLQVSPEPTTLLLDDYSAALSGNWTTGGTVAPLQSNGNAAFSPGTTTNASSFMRTNAGFLLRSGTFLINAHIIQIEAAAVTNNIRWWGYGSQATTPSYATPLQNAAIFMIDGTAGALQAVTYSATSKTVVATLTRPTDAAQHRYEIRYRQSIVYWVIDGVTVATKTFPNLAVATGLNGLVGSFNNSTAPSASPVLNASSFTISDLGGNNKTLSDGALPWIQATVKNGNQAVVIADNALAVGIHPTTPLPAGSNTIGTVNANPILPAGYYVTLAATTNATAFKTSAGALYEVTCQNATASTIYVKLFNKASAPTVGTDVPVDVITVAGGATVTKTYPPYGKRFTLGIAYATTNAYAPTDTAVISAGPVLSFTWV